MHFDVDSRTILLVRSGSHAYGLNTPESDEDYRGVCIKPKECYLGFYRKFEQQEHCGKGDGIDRVIYSLDKFASLAADCNPNIIEVIHVADEDVVKCDNYGGSLRAIADRFLSKRAKHTFSGYAHAQLQRIKTHREWLLNPPKAEPKREDFGLADGVKLSKGEIGAYAAMLEKGLTVEVPKNLVTAFVKERAYNSARQHWEQYVNWKKTRNPKRAELEAKFGYDTKHGMHLIRLMKMCYQILSGKGVIVKRTEDREELLGIRRGDMSYEQLISYAERLEAECDSLYLTSTLPKEPDRERLDEVIIKLTESYLASV